jgi:WW domain-containing oxidoreductase
MAGTVLITGANGSLGLPFVNHLLTTSPSHTLIAAVRNVSPTSDKNTTQLSHIISRHPAARASIEQLDLSSLANVRTFADTVAQRVASGDLPPIAAIVCNAFTWSLDGQHSTPDGFEATFQVGHLGHYLLVLKLLKSMSPTGRVVMLGSTAHYPDRPNPLSKLVAGIPEDIEELGKPTADKPGEEHDRGFQRYGNAKLANVMFMHDLNRRLQQVTIPCHPSLTPTDQLTPRQDPKLSSITVTAMDPGGMVDSRAHTHQKLPIRAVMAVANTLMPLLRHITTDMRRAADSANDLVELSVGDRFQGARGYYVGVKTDKAAEASKDEKDCERLWGACWEWTGMVAGETVLTNAEPRK